jgi:hypothetical protein
MQFRVIPFTANIASHEGAATAAGQLEHMIASLAAEGWEYVRLEHVDTHVAGVSGCFGIGERPALNLSVAMAVFRK